MLKYLFIPLIVLFVIITVVYWEFVAEDSYIVARYAENLVNERALEYNVGERINALTSPAHALIEALIYRVTGATVTGWKFLALILLVASVALVCHVLRGCVYAQLLATATLLISPSIILWTLGGLETPLLLFGVTILASVVFTTTNFASDRLYVICAVAGLAFLVRYDSVTFTGPLVLYSLIRAQSLHRAVRALVLAAILPVAWLAVSQLYFGDPLPTSFYEKTPTFFKLSNLRYVVFYLFVLHLIPWGLWVWAQHPRVFRVGLHRWRWLAWSSLLILAYGLSAATKHMMFSFRLLLPYIPGYVLMLGDMTRQCHSALEVPAQRRRFTLLFSVLLTGIVLSQAYQAYFTYTRSVNGLWTRGEYSRLGLRDYVRFMDTLAMNADDTAAHWQALNRSGPPRVTTFAAGLLPYRFQEAYVYSSLVSLRHQCPEALNIAPLCSDYVHVLAPRHGPVGDQLLRAAERFELVSSYTISFDGSAQTFAVYFNLAPATLRLPTDINGPCDLLAQIQ